MHMTVQSSRIPKPKLQSYPHEAEGNLMGCRGRCGQKWEFPNARGPCEGGSELGGLGIRVEKGDNHVEKVT